MTHVTNELIYEVLRQIQDTAGVKAEARHANALLDAMQTQMIVLQQGVQNIYAILGRHDARVDRIERRLKLVEAA